MKYNIDARSVESVQTWLTQWVCTELSCAATEIDVAKTFLSYGMNSIQAMMLVGDLEDSLGRRLPPTLVWDYPSIQVLAYHVVEKAAALPSPRAATEKVNAGAQSPLAPTTPAQYDQSDPEALLDKLPMLSDEEVDSLLQQYLKRAGQ